MESMHSAASSNSKLQIIPINDSSTLRCQEVNHRVANSLQLLAALLPFSNDGAATAETQRVIDLVRGRIIAIADLHRHLCQQPRQGSVRLAEYMADLVGHLNASHGGLEAGNTIHVATTAILVPADFASVLGVMLAELVTNARKHAYSPVASCKIDVRIHSPARGRLWMEVQDYGSGREVMSPKRTAGLGSQIIDALCRQIGAFHGYAADGSGTRFFLSTVVPGLAR